jgi:threonine aldolase
MINEQIDLRSDTITRPVPEMRQAMANAEVGDDVFGDDPTITELETATAKILGKEAAVYVPSGTMANQLAVRCHTQPGDEILLDANAHIFWYEAGAPAALSGASCRVIQGTRGIFSVDQFVEALRPANIHLANTRLVALENTHNRGGGSIWPLDQLTDVCLAAREKNIVSHLDGARLWNASIATGISESDYAKHVDSVSVCFSKGLGAPVGSVLAGSSAFIDRARYFRKQFGGGMRQAGIIAAGALYALRHHRDRLKEDHDNARKLGLGLAEVPGIKIDSDSIVTNLVYFDVEHMTATEMVLKLAQSGVLVMATSPSTIRAVTSLEVDDKDIDNVILKVAKIASEMNE